MSSEEQELRKKLDEYCSSRVGCKGCIFNDAVSGRCLDSSIFTGDLKRLEALNRFKEEVLDEEKPNKVNLDNILNKAIEKFGLLQLVKASEECCELAQALNKYYCMRQADDTCDFNKLEANIIEEIADVEIMIEQVKRLLDLNNKDIELIKKDKIERLGDKL